MENRYFKTDNMSSVARFVFLAVVWSLSAFYSWLMCVVSFLRFLKSPLRFFTVKKREIRPECLDDPVFTHSYVRLKNIRMHYVHTGQEDKPLMLCLHGFPEFWYSWRHQLKEFKDQYRVVACDIRGYGETEAPDSIEEYVIQKMIEDTRELILALGYENCVLVAHDWGGAIAWRFGVDYPDMVNKLIVMDAPHFSVFTKYMSGHLSQFLKSWYMFFFQMPWLPEKFCRFEDMKIFDDCFKDLLKKEVMTQEDIEAYKYTFRHPFSFTAPLNYYRTMSRIPFKKATSKRITMPTLVLWGSNDSALSTELGELTGDYVDNFSFQVLEGATHWLQQDEPDKVNKIMRDWLQKSG